MRCALAAALLAITVLAACGGGGGGSSGGGAVPQTPTPTPAPSSTPFPGNAALSATFTTSLPAGAHVASFTFSSGATTIGTQSAALPLTCAAQSCTVTVSAPLGASAAQALAYAVPGPSASPLAIATAAVTGISNQSAAVNFTPNGVMSSFTIALVPSTVNAGQYANVLASVTALDAAGDTLPAGFVNGAFVAPTFTESVSDPTAAVAVLSAPLSALYAGYGSGPATITVKSGALSNAATLQYAAAAALSIDYAGYIPNPVLQSTPPPLVQELASPGSTTSPRTFAFANGANGIAFDPNSTLWVQSSSTGPIGTKVDGSFGGLLSAPGTLLTFDASGNLYVVPAGLPSQVSVYSVVGTTATLTRTITVPNSVCSAAGGTNGTFYVALCGSNAGVYQYPAIGSGVLTPVAQNASAGTPVATDAQGNVYASYGSRLARWNTASFGNVPPSITYPNQGLPSPPNSAAVDAAGNLFATYLGAGGAWVLAEFPTGSTSATILSAAASTVVTPIR